MKDVNKGRILLLEDGTIYKGTAFGSAADRKVELVFNTSMVGYQEILSDPSYTDQAVVMTYPLIGNYGMCEDDYETIIPTISGLAVREYCDDPSNFRAANTLDQIMERYNIAGIEGIDTREITRHIRDYGSCKAYILSAEADTDAALAELRAWIPARDQVSRVSTDHIYDYENGEESSSKDPGNAYHVVAIDCGMKLNILREMKRKGMEITVVPWNTTADEILALKPDGIFISNGPGDPSDVVPTITAIRQLIGKCPIFGICLGHQIISLAYGARTYKLKFGHRGGNHPVKNLMTGRVEITSQNHSYAVETESLADTPLAVSHINLLDQTVEGVMCRSDKVFSVQYHPESAPGPQDSSYLFDVFLQFMKEAKEEQCHA